MRPLIHIGYHKTGSTWLQDHLFPNAELGFALLLPRREVGRALIYRHPLDFDPSSCAELFAPELKNAEARGLVPVISSERLSGNPHSGGYDSKEVADRLREVFPDGRILIVIREQQAMILSCYRQYIKEGGICSLEQYLHPPNHGGIRIPLFDPKYFEYDRLIGYYSRLFGAENVLVLAFESFLKKPLEFVQAIVGFSGAKGGDLGSLPVEKPSNPSESAFLLDYTRRVNPLVTRDTLNPSGGRAPEWARPAIMTAGRISNRVMPAAAKKRVDLRVKEYVRTYASGRFKESNARVAAMTGRPLAELGYEI